MINKTTIDPQLNISDLSTIYKQPIAITVNEFNEKAFVKFRDDFQKASNTGQEVIPIIIDSFGGQAYSLLGMMGVIDSSKIPVATIGIGKMMSCGSLLLSCGNKGMRYMCPHSTALIHDVAHAGRGKVEEIKATAAEADRLNDMIYKRMARNCGQEEGFFLDKIHEKAHANWYLGSIECKDIGLINHIGIPSFTTKIKVKTRFGL